MIIVRQSTARTVIVGPVLTAAAAAVTDGVVGDFKISKNGGAPAGLNASATLTHRNTGHYSLALTATDLDTVGQAEIVIDDTTNLCHIKALVVIEEAIYDALFAASANAFTGAAGSTTLTALADGGITAAKIAADAITDAKVASDVTIASVTGAVGSVTGGATAAALATVDTVVDAILALLDDPRAEPGQGAPAVNADMATKLDYLYKWTRNKKTNDGADTKFYADDGTTVDHKQATSEAGGTVTKAEIVTGP